MAVEDPHGDIKIDSAVGELEFSQAMMFFYLLRSHEFGANHSELFFSNQCPKSESVGDHIVQTVRC